jgi:hypothetical protein
MRFVTLAAAECLLALAALAPADGQWLRIVNIQPPNAQKGPPVVAGPAGSIWVGGSGSAMLIAPSGEVKATVRVGEAIVYGLAPAADGGVVVAATNSTGGFVLKADASGNTLWSLPIAARPMAVAIDGSGAAYITGAASEEFRTTPGVPKPDIGDKRCSNRWGEIYWACDDAFVAKVRPDGSGIEWATFHGGTQTELAWAIAVDATGAVWIAGETRSEDYAATPDGAQRTFGGLVTLGPFTYGDAFVAKFDARGQRLQYSTFLGGSSVDEAFAMTADSSGGVFVTGRTQSINFPVSPMPSSTTIVAGKQRCRAVMVTPS